MKWIFYCATLFIAPLSARPIQMEINGRNAILMNGETGAILYEKHAHTPVYPASTTKIATALYVLDKKQVDLNQQVTVTAEALKSKTAKNRGEALPHWLESDGTALGIVRGEILSMETLLHGLMLVSGNDAANVIAETVSGSVPQFMEELNAYLKTIGCKQTTFYTPHGYHYEHHMTTAYDLAIMTQKALQNPIFREIVGKDSYVKPKSNKQPARELTQFNKLVVKDHKHYYPKAIGVKTGYYGLAGNNIVAAAVDQGRTLIAVILGAPKKALGLADARNLFEAAFAEKPVSRVLVEAMQTYERKIEGAKTALTAILPQDFIHSYYPAEESEIKAFVYWENLKLPIKKGEKVGQICAYDKNEQVVAVTDLFAKESVEPTFLFSMKEKWNCLFNR